MPVFLHGLSLQFYRGIGPERQCMGPFKDFNFFIGPNNAGKSTVLNFINDHIPFRPDNGFADYSDQPLNQYRGAKTGKVAVEIGTPLSGEVDRYFGYLSEEEHSIARESIQKVLSNFSESKVLWFEVDVQRRLSYIEAASRASLRNLDANNMAQLLTLNQWTKLAKDIYSQNVRGISERPDLIEEMAKRMVDLIARNISRPDCSKIPNTAMIPTIREIGPKGVSMSDFSGSGLIDRLAEIQSPDHDKREEQKLFHKINAFLQQVTGKADSRIEIPHSREHVLVHMDNKVLPLDSLGTGIHEVIMIAAFCTISENQIVCIEEPEIHLHPVLQRKLIRYLKENTSNQYFIATHSAAFIDTEGAAIFRVTNDGVQTRVESATLDGDKLSICRDLGYKASDILQANAVIWVEGPSDRIYINHWIKAVNADLVEGIHYSIMFYGGRLLSHLGADWEVLDELINLRKINQNLAVVIDSDRAKKGEPLNATKRRIRDELDGGAVAWVTKGREIENYVAHSVLQAAVKAVHPQLYGKPASGGQYDHALHFIKAETLKEVHKEANKVRVARKVCEQAANLDVLDLKSQIKALVKMIENANQ